MDTTCHTKVTCNICKWDENILDRKVHNLKKIYRIKKDNNKKSSTGRSRIH